MDEEPKKEQKLPSMLEMSEMFDRVLSQMHPISHNFERLNSIQGISSQYEHFNPAASFADIASKNFEQQNLAFANVIASSVSATLAQPQMRESIALQDSFRKIAESLSVNNNVMLAAESAIQKMDRNNVYKDTMASFSQFRKSLKPLRDSLNTAGNAFDRSEFANLVRELQTSRIIPESTMSEYVSIIKQVESLHNLESFKAITRLKNFPNDKTWTQNYDKGYEVTEDFLAEVKTIDARISDEISSVDDFNELSESSKNSLEKLNLSYYQIFIIYYIYCITILREQISNSLKYSDMEFKFVGWSSKILVGVCFIGFQPDFNSICNSIVATILLDNIKQDGKK